MNKQHFIYEPIDSWFFRESRPSDALGNNELSSVFPPPVRTLLGALRTAIGEQWHADHGTTWGQFNQLKELQALIGYGNHLGPLSARGPFIQYKAKRYYPAPANIMVKEISINGGAEKKQIFFALKLDKTAIDCDIGKVCLATFPEKMDGLEDLAGAKPAHGYWVNTAGFNAILKGKNPQASDFIKLSNLITQDPRLGIARDNARAGVKEGMLYQTCHIRLAEGLKVELAVAGLPAQTEFNTKIPLFVRLGGEGRLSGLETQDAQPMPQGQIHNQNLNVMIYLVTPMLCAPNGLPAGIPAGFAKTTHESCDVWEGKINGISLRIWSVVSDKALREGGWDLQTHQSMPVSSYVPAGTALFAEILDNKPLTEVLEALHDKVINDDTSSEQSLMGRAHMLIGQWFA